MNEQQYHYITDAEYEQAAAKGINKSTLYQRVNAGMDKQRALTQPTRQKINWGKWREIGEKNGLTYETIRRRVQDLGWSMELATTTPIVPNTEMWKYRKKAREQSK